MNAADALPVRRWSPESEHACLGALLSGSGTAWDAAQPLGHQDFFDKRHGLIFQAIGEMRGRKVPVDPVTVFEHLRDLGQADEVGGLPYLNDLSQAGYGDRTAGAHAKRIREQALDRRLLAVLDEARGIASGPGVDAADKLDQITSLLGQLQRQGTAKMPRSATEIAVGRLDHWTALESGAALSGWPVGFDRLDEMLGGGLRPGGLYILGGRPGGGKTSFALRIAAQAGLVGLFLSQEMASGELVDRLVASVGRVEYAALQTGKFADNHWGRITQAVDSQALRRLLLDDQGGLTLGDIRLKAKAVPGLQILVLDYLQLCAGAEGSRDNRNSQIEQITRGLKALAKELGIAVLCLSQLGRGVESRAGNDKRPVLSDLRDRHGRTGQFALNFDGALQVWAESNESLGQVAVQNASRLGKHD